MRPSPHNFEQVYQSNKDRIYRLCRGYLGPVPEADDLFQEVFLRVWQALGNFRGEAQVDTWVYRIGINTALLWRKREAKRKANEVSGMAGAELATAPEGGASEQSERLAGLQKAISQLKPLDRVVIGMVLEGFKHAEIAASTGLTTNNVGVKVNRIKSALRKIMEAQS